MGRQTKIAYLAVLFLSLAGCSVQEPPVETDISKPMEDISEPVVSEPQEAAPPPNIIPRVEDEIVDAEESPIEVAEPQDEEEPAEVLKDESTEPVTSEAVAEDINESVAIASEAAAAAEVNATVDEPSEDVNATVIELNEELNATEPPVEESAIPEDFEPFTQQIGVLKIEIAEEMLRIKMKDPIVKYFSLSDPDRIVIDFRDIRYLEPQAVTIRSPWVNKIATAAHDNYNRVVFYLNAPAEYTITPERGEWVIRLKK